MIKFFSTCIDEVETFFLVVTKMLIAIIDSFRLIFNYLLHLLCVIVLNLLI